MVAMILAAGLGTRLRPLTNDVPKALVPIDGVPMLERVARRCLDAGAERLVINVSHLGEQVVEFLEDRGYFGVDVQISEEPDGPLETGGGIKKAMPFLPSDEPLLVHNVDVMTNVDLSLLYRTHAQRDEESLATLAVTGPETDRFLLFDSGGLVGYGRSGAPVYMRDAVGQERQLDFCGVHVLSPEMLRIISDEPDEKFSVMDTYLRQAKAGKTILAFEADGQRSLDIGTHERLAAAEDWVAAQQV